MIMALDSLFWSMNLFVYSSMNFIIQLHSMFDIEQLLSHCSFKNIFAYSFVFLLPDEFYDQLIKWNLAWMGLRWVPRLVRGELTGLSVVLGLTPRNTARLPACTAALCPCGELYNFYSGAVFIFVFVLLGLFFAILQFLLLFFVDRFLITFWSGITGV